MNAVFIALCIWAQTHTGQSVLTDPSTDVYVEQSIDKKANVPYTEGKRFFVKNTYVEGDLKTPKITSQEVFDKYFGMAPIMGEGGQPTKIDFSKQYVIAVIGKSSNMNPTMKVESLVKNGNKLVLSYQYKLESEQSYTLQPVIIVVVDNKYQGNVVLEQVSK